MRRLMYISALLVLSACGAKEVLPRYDKDSKIQGLATPIQLSGGETEVILEDYFLDVLQIDSIVAPPCFKVNLADDKKTVVLIADNEQIPRLSVLKVWVDGVDYSITKVFLTDGLAELTVSTWMGGDANGQAT